VGATWRLVPEELPPTWLAIPAGQGSITVGSQLLASLTSSMLLVPSVIVPEEPVVLVNPKHPDSSRIQARVVRRFEYNLSSGPRVLAHEHRPDE
jgi:hypothetical protein